MVRHSDSSNVNLTRDGRAQILGQAGRGRGIARQLGQLVEPRAQGRVLRDTQQRAGERAGQGSSEILAKIEQLVQILGRGVAQLTGLAREQRGSLAMAGAIEKIGRERDRAPAGGRWARS